MLKRFLTWRNPSLPTTNIINSFFKNKLYKKEILCCSISLKWNCVGEINKGDMGEIHKVVDFHNPECYEWAAEVLILCYQRYVLTYWSRNLQVAVAFQIHEDNAMWLYYPCGDEWHKVLL